MERYNNHRKRLCGKVHLASGEQRVSEANVKVAIHSKQLDSNCFVIDYDRVLARTKCDDTFDRHITAVSTVTINYCVVMQMLQLDDHWLIVFAIRTVFVCFFLYFSLSLVYLIKQLKYLNALS